MMINDGVLIIPPNIEKIDNGTYKNNKNITDIIFEPRDNNLPLTIGKYAFKNCNLTGELAIPSFVVEIGDFAFENNTNLISIEFEHNRDLTLSIGDLPLSIGDYAFSKCNLFELMIPKYITKIGKNSFGENHNLSEIIFEPRDDNLSLIIEDYAFRECDLEKLTIPPFITSIGVASFIGNVNLTSIKFEPRDNHLVIGQYAFCACNITGELIIPNLVSDIERGAFAKNKNLISIKFEAPNSELNIGNYAFYKCNIQELIIPQFIKNIGSYVFANNDQLSKITIPVHIIENYEHIDEDNDGYDEYYLTEYDEDEDIYEEFEEFDKYNYKDAIFGDKDDKKIYTLY